MNELDLVKRFRDDVPEPSSDARLRARAAIAAAAADSDGSTAAGMARIRRSLAGPRRWIGGTHLIRAWSASRRRSVAGAAALAMLVTAAALLALAPWSSSPDFLARAATALTPGPGRILYESWESTLAPGHRSSFKRLFASFKPDRMWIEGGSSHRYRVVLEPRLTKAPAPKVPGFGSLGFLYGVGSVYSSGSAQRFEHLGHALEGQARKGHALELGGTLRQNALRQSKIPRSLTFVPPDELWSARLLVSFGAPLPGPEAEIETNVVDPLSELRAAIAEGRAHAAGTTQLEGRTVERIDFDPPPAHAHTHLVDPRYVYSHSYAYVEPKSFHPVEIDLNGSYVSILAYEYLPATAANLALTSIRAQHPTATVVHERRPASP